MTGLGATFDQAGAPPAPSSRAASLAGTRERWRMGIEARALVLVMAVLFGVGGAVLFSAMAPVAVEAYLHVLIHVC